MKEYASKVGALPQDAPRPLKRCSGRHVWLNDDVEALSQYPMQMSQLPRKVHVSQCKYTYLDAYSWIPMRIYISQGNVMNPKVDTWIPMQVHESQGKYTDPKA